MSSSPGQASLIFDQTNPTSIFFPTTSRHCETEHSGRRTQEGCRGMCSDPLDPGAEERGCSVGCILGMSDVSPFRAFAPLDAHTEFPKQKKCIFIRVFWVRRDFGQFRSSGARKIVIFWCSDWPRIVILFQSIACNFEIYSAHRRSLLQEVAAAEDASRAAVHVESFDAMRSPKAQCQAPPDNPETGDTYRSRERNCTGEKIEHQNVYKRHSSSAPPTITTTTIQATASNIIPGGA